MQQRKSRFSSYTPNFVGAEPAAALASVPVAETPPPPSAIEPSVSPPRKVPAGKGRTLPHVPSKRVREMSDYVSPFSARLRPEQAQIFDTLVIDTGKSRVRLLEEALTMLFKHYGTGQN